MGLSSWLATHRPLTFVQIGDWVALDTAGPKLSMEESNADLARRREGWTPPKPPLVVRSINIDTY